MGGKDKLLVCQGCEMWVEYSKSRLSFKGVSFENTKADGFEYRCKKCIKLADLEERLEACECNWEEVREGAVATEIPGEVGGTGLAETTNRFSTLEVEEVVPGVMSDRTEEGAVVLPAQIRWLRQRRAPVMVV